tara:strand:- start:3628 stop:4041 length:414 start_codon:yes stop_codon:yes gene_type:complete
MNIVLDANIIIAALLGSRGKLIILTSQNYNFYAPKKIIEEIKRYEKEICNKIDCSIEEFNINFKALMFFINIIEQTKYKEHIDRAKIEMKERDVEDADYIACALAVNADFIWTEDKDFLDQNLVNVKTTEQFIKENK